MRKKIKKNILSPPEHKYNYEVVGQDFPFFFPEKIRHHQHQPSRNWNPNTTMKGFVAKNKSCS
jgi:hypothetical protein